MIKYPYIIAGISVLVWAAIPFRQLGKKYFYYFYIFALVDPLSIYLRLLFHSSSNFFYVFGSLLALISIQNALFIKRYKLPLFIFLIITSILYFYLNLSGYIALFAFIRFLILLTLLKDLVNNILENRIFNFFIAALILDETLTLFKFLGIISGASNNYFYYYTSTAFDIIIGLFFWIKEDNPRLLFKLIKN